MTDAVLVHVEWIDAAHQREVDEPHRFGLARLHSVGWLVREDEHCLVIAGEVGPDERGFRELVAIPHQNIVRRKDRALRIRLDG